MPVVVELGDDELAVVLSGWDRIWAMRSHVAVPREAVKSASAASKRVLLDQVAMRMRGTSAGSRVVAGSYSVWPHARVAKGDRQFWSTYSADTVLSIETDVARPRRIVLQVEDPYGKATEIEAWRTQIEP